MNLSWNTYGSSGYKYANCQVLSGYEYCYMKRGNIYVGKSNLRIVSLLSAYYFTPLSENSVKNAMCIPRGNLTRFVTSCKLNTNPFKHLKRLWLYLSAKLIKLGSERCYFPDILKIGKEKGTSQFAYLYPLLHVLFAKQVSSEIHNQLCYILLERSLDLESLY